MKASNGFFTRIIAAIVGFSICYYNYLISGNFLLLIASSLILLSSLGYIFYMFRGLLCKERIRTVGRIICARCRGYYVGLLLAIILSAILTHHTGIPCFPFGQSVLLLLLATVLGIPTMIQGALRRTERIESTTSSHVTFFGFLVGIAIVISFLGFYSLFGCPPLLQGA